MSLNIKNEETHQLARELAALTGESMTGAITVALRERLRTRDTRAKRGDSGAGAALHCSTMRQVLLENGPSAVEHGDYLYDEDGLPR